MNRAVYRGTANGRGTNGWAYDMEIFGHWVFSRTVQFVPIAEVCVRPPVSLNPQLVRSCANSVGRTLIKAGGTPVSVCSATTGCREQVGVDLLVSIGSDTEVAKRLSWLGDCVN